MAWWTPPQLYYLKFIWVYQIKSMHCNPWPLIVYVYQSRNGSTMFVLAPSPARATTSKPAPSWWHSTWNRLVRLQSTMKYVNLTANISFEYVQIKTYLKFTHKVSLIKPNYLHQDKTWKMLNHIIIVIGVILEVYWFASVDQNHYECISWLKETTSIRSYMDAIMCGFILATGGGMVGLTSVKPSSDGQWTVTQISCHSGNLTLFFCHHITLHFLALRF